MKISLWIVAAMSLFNLNARADLHCEGAINAFLEHYKDDQRTKPLAETVNASDFTSGAIRRVQAPQKVDDSYSNKSYAATVKFAGATTGSKTGIRIDVQAYHESPKSNERGKFIGPMADQEIHLKPDCTLDYFVVMNFQPAGEGKYTLTPVQVNADECLSILQSRKLTTQQLAQTIVERKKLPVAMVDVYAKRVIPNCRHRSNASSDPKVAYPPIVRLAASPAKLNALYKKACPECENNKAYEHVDGTSAHD